MQASLENYSYKVVEGLKQKCVLLRSCLNVNIDQNGNITDKTRLVEALPMIKTLAAKSKSLVVCGHLGRPKSKEQNLSFRRNIYPSLKSELSTIGVELVFVDSASQIPEKDRRPSGTIYLMENIRFDPREESKNTVEQLSLAKELSQLADIFVNDAFADYRSSVSTYHVAKQLPSYLGDLFFREIDVLSKFENPPKPYIAILGGAKLSEKIDLLVSLVEKADKILLGGAMAYTILKAKGVAIGSSLFEQDKIDLATEIIGKYKEKIVLPVDHLIIDDFNEASENTQEITENDEIPQGKIAIDIGPKTIETFKKIISNASSILWNGPMGIFEREVSSLGTKEIAGSITKNKNAFTLVGGGDSIASINKFKITGFSHVCTGGGAMMAYLSSKSFPTLDIILNQNNSEYFAKI